MQRRLTAILSADVVGYSGLMEANETGTLERLKANRSAIFDPCVTRHGGRVFKLMGDGALAEFSSVVAAVHCALEIQAATAAAEPDVAEETRIRYRIGINLGDIIVDGDEIYGEGVNVAARLQTLAPPGGIALSRVVREQVDSKLPCVYEDMGEHTVKNIERPVHVYSARVSDSASFAQHKAEAPRKVSICVLPFSNMSGDSEQEYFSDGISEDIITDLSKVSTLSVVARNTAFTFKGKAVDVPQLARQLNVGYVLEGSVRKARARVRITAQLIDGAAGDHVWAERWDRDLDDIFALQDEISEAIVGAVRLRLLPEEKRAIERRGTNSPDAYNLFLMARQQYASGNQGDTRRDDAIIHLCRRAIEIDPGYARAWALMALAQTSLHFRYGRPGDDGLVAAERALLIDPTLAEPHGVKARHLRELGRSEEAFAETEIALQLDPESYEVNLAAGYVHFRERHFDTAIRHYEKAAAAMETDYHSTGTLQSCYTAIGDMAGVRRAAQMTLARAEKAVAQDQSNGSAMGFAVVALAALGENERARNWIDRAIRIDPENLNMRYNFACALCVQDPEAALDLLGPLFSTTTITWVNHMKVDPDLDAIRKHPRFIAMAAEAETRLASETKPSPQV